MNNYEFCANWISDSGGRVLDYGCGAGQIVEILRNRGIDAWGCETFYEGGDTSTQVPEAIAQFILSMSDTIPFEGKSFDAVVSNTVMEHVTDLDQVFAEIARVLRPRGRSLHIFPHLECWREGHCEIPFLHRFPPGKTRNYYAAALRSLGFGTHHKGKSVMEWSQDFCSWLDDWTCYRPLSEIKSTASRYFENVSFIEPQWLQARIPRARSFPEFLQRLVVRKMAGVVMVTEGRRM